MSRLSCARAGCGHVICLDAATEQRLRETHASFFCPAQHSNYFPQKTDAEKEIERLKGDVRREADHRHSWMSLYDRTVEQRDEARRLSRTCPLCGTRFRTPRRLPEHLAEAHGAELASPLSIEALR